MSRRPFRVGDRVRPAPGYDALHVPSGVVRAVVPWGRHGVVYVEGSPIGWVAEAFEHVPFVAEVSA